jgi:hypothetical protein
MIIFREGFQNVLKEILMVKVRNEYGLGGISHFASVFD